MPRYICYLYSRNNCAVKFGFIVLLGWTPQQNRSEHLELGRSFRINETKQGYATGQGSTWISCLFMNAPETLMVWYKISLPRPVRNFLYECFYLLLTLFCVLSGFTEKGGYTWCIKLKTNIHTFPNPSQAKVSHCFLLFSFYKTSLLPECIAMYIRLLWSIKIHLYKLF